MEFILKLCVPFKGRFSSFLSPTLSWEDHRQSVHVGRKPSQRHKHETGSFCLAVLSQWLWNSSCGAWLTDPSPTWPEGGRENSSVLLNSHPHPVHYSLLAWCHLEQNRDPERSSHVPQGLWLLTSRSGVLLHECRAPSWCSVPGQSPQSLVRTFWSCVWNVRSGAGEGEEPEEKSGP